MKTINDMQAEIKGLETQVAKAKKEAGLALVDALITRMKQEKVQVENYKVNRYSSFDSHTVDFSLPGDKKGDACTLNFYTRPGTGE